MKRSHRPRTISALAVAVAATALLLVAAGIGSAAAPVVHEHENFTDTFADSVCGIPGTSVVRGVDTFTLSADNLFKDNFEVTQTFTAADSGKSIVFHVAEQVTGNDEPIDNGDGTLTFVNTFKGLPEQIRLPNGPVLTRDAGVVTFTILVDAETDEFISQTVSGEKGPHPDLDSDFAIFCDVVVPALS
jgi:FlaG/FlaF family flagellin (archaellin)